MTPQREEPLHEERSSNPGTRQGERRGPARAGGGAGAEPVDSTVALILLGLKAVAQALEAEVTALPGERYRRTGGQPGLVRWSQERGSVYLADQKLPITYRRLRDLPGESGAPPARLLATAATR